MACLKEHSKVYHRKGVWIFVTQDKGWYLAFGNLLGFVYLFTLRQKGGGEGTKVLVIGISIHHIDLLSYIDTH